jgi:RNA polymerase sigma-70 factor, ECF subfamily
VLHRERAPGEVADDRDALDQRERCRPGQLEPARRHRTGQRDGGDLADVPLIDHRLVRLRVGPADHVPAAQLRRDGAEGVRGEDLAAQHDRRDLGPHDGPLDLTVAVTADARGLAGVRLVDIDRGERHDALDPRPPCTLDEAGGPVRSEGTRMHEHRFDVAQVVRVRHRLRTEWHGPWSPAGHGTHLLPVPEQTLDGGPPDRARGARHQNGHRDPLLDGRHRLPFRRGGGAIRDGPSSHPGNWLRHPVMSGSDIEVVWQAERPRLLRIAERMLRDRQQAEDVVQEAFLRLSREDGVDEPGAWLSVVTSRLCLDQLRSAAHRHERTVGDETLGALAPAAGDPADRVTLDDRVRAALLVLLDRLSPAERVSFVLHDVFALSFSEIAETLGRTEDSARQLASRARRRLADAGPAGRSDARADSAVVERFLAACRGGDLKELVDALHADAWGLARFVDGSPDAVNRGAVDVAENLLRFLGPPALLVADGRTVHAFRGLDWFAAVTLDVSGERIRSIEAVVDPSPTARGSQAATPPS